MPRVSEVMVSDVVTIDSSASIIDAARQMISEEKGPLPVMEGDSLRAMITDRDIIGQEHLHTGSRAGQEGAGPGRCQKPHGRDA